MQQKFLLTILLLTIIHFDQKLCVSVRQQQDQQQSDKNNEAPSTNTISDEEANGLTAGIL